jgi:hypothetical protein
MRRIGRPEPWSWTVKEVGVNAGAAGDGDGDGAEAVGAVEVGEAVGGDEEAHAARRSDSSSHGTKEGFTVPP